MPIEPYLATLIDEEWGHAQKVAAAAFKVCSRIRHHWNEDVSEEHTAWREYSQVLLDANQRTIIWGRPGLRLKVDESQPFQLGALKEVEGTVIDAALDALIPAFPSSKVWRIAMDGKYYCPQPDDFAKIIGWDWLDSKPWIAEKFDCDEFAFAFKGRLGDLWMVNSVGLIIDWSSTHAYNVVVLADGKALAYEPQDDTIPKIGEGIHRLEAGVILI